MTWGLCLLLAKPQCVAPTNFTRLNPRGARGERMGCLEHVLRDEQAGSEDGAAKVRSFHSLYDSRPPKNLPLLLSRAYRRCVMLADLRSHEREPRWTVGDAGSAARD